MSITSEQAAEMQARVNAHKTKHPTTQELNRDLAQFIEDVEKRTETPHSELAPKTGATVGTKAERNAGAATAQPQQRKSKYGNRKIEIDGFKFDSVLEGKRYGELKWMKHAGEVLDFKMQVTYRIDVNGIHICNYRADFVVTYPDGRTEVEDTKGVETPEFKLKKKLMLAVHGIKIVLIRSKK